MYADDCQIYLSFSNNTDQAEELFNQCLIQIKNWMDSNFLKLNTDKTKLKMFNPRSESVQICINFNNSLIVPSETVDILGVKLSQNINYSSFISKKVQAIYFHLRNLNHIRDSLPHSARVLLVTNLVLSKLDYCNSLLICATGKDLRPLRIMLNRAVRFIFDIRRREHITPYLKKLHILPILFRIKFKVCLLAFKILNDKAPVYLKEKFVTFYPTTTIDLRDGCGRDNFMFKHLKDTKDKTRDTVFDKLIEEWNLLPLNIRKVKSVNVFKTRLKTFYFKKAFE